MGKVILFVALLALVIWQSQPVPVHPAAAASTHQSAGHIAHTAFCGDRAARTALRHADTLLSAPQGAKAKRSCAAPARSVKR